MGSKQIPGLVPQSQLDSPGLLQQLCPLRGSALSPAPSSARHQQEERGAAHPSVSLADFRATPRPPGTGLSPFLLCLQALSLAQIGLFGRRVAGRASPWPVSQSLKEHGPSGLAQFTTQPWPASQHLWNREQQPHPHNLLQFRDWLITPGPPCIHASLQHPR